jgi:hypothetical protein
MPGALLERRVLGYRFEVVAQLGAGGMGEVYRAHDRTRGAEVALKVLRDLDAGALLRFKNEFRALHDVEHPNLVRLHELHEDRGTWFFTMQLVDGVDVLTWIGDDEARLRQVLPQIARALQRLHDDGLVHRDVKPSNIRVTPPGTAIVLDFGLVAASWDAADAGGTPAYMAPEQVAGDVTPAADWYAFGVLLFRALTGRLPFVGSAEQVLADKQHREPPRVHQLAPHAPADLAALADALLARSATARPSGTAVLSALGAAADAGRLAQSFIVGRDRELAELRRAVADRMAGEPFAVEIVGESGIGKTTLLRAFAQELAEDVLVVNGRCWERESVPYKGFDGVVDELAARLAHLEWTLPDAGWSSLLAQAFPALRAAPGFTPRAAYPLAGHETAARVPMALRWLLAEIAARQPLVVVIDDLQWADRDTIALLRAVLDPPVPQLLVVFAAREHVHVDTRATLRSLQLAPLSEDDTATLVELVAREHGGRIDTSAVAREAAGHPLLAAELARHAVATGEVTAVTLDDVVRRLVAHQRQEARRLAAAASIAHAPLSVDAAARAIEASHAAVLLMGHAERAGELLDELMRWLGLPNPVEPRRVVLALLRRRAAVRLRRLALPGPHAAEASPLDRARVDVLWDAAAGFALIDPLRAFYFHSLNFDMCFRIGDRSRIARALMGEIPYAASSGRQSRRLRRLFALSDEAAERAAFPPLVPLTRGSTAFFFGRWRECRDNLALCEQLLAQDRPRMVREGFGLAQLHDFTRRLQLVATLYLGELATLRRRIPELLADALERNDLSSATHVRSGVQTLFFLACGDVDAARRHAEDAFRPWRASRIGVPHVMDLQSRANVDIYLGRGGAAHRSVRELWKQLADAHLMRTQYIHITLLDLRARGALAAAAELPPGKRRDLVADAARCARLLRDIGAVWSVPLADAIEARIARAVGNPLAGRVHLERAAAGFDAADMALHAATARLEAAVLAGEHAVAAEQRRALATAGVVEIERYTRLLLP